MEKKIESTDYQLDLRVCLQVVTLKLNLSGGFPFNQGLGLGYRGFRGETGH